MSNDPSFELPAVTAMREDWAMVSPLMGGTKAMRAAGKTLLPQWPAESDDSYKARLQVSTLIPAYSETVATMTARVFAEPLQLGDDANERIVSLCDDIDREGRDLNNWSVDFFAKGLSHGLCHAFVDTPQAYGVRTKAEEIAANIRPYLVLVKPEQVLGWRIDEGKLIQIRFRETVEEIEGEFGLKTIQQIRVLEPGIWRVYRAEEKDGKKAYVLSSEGRTGLTEIPWVTFYTGRTGSMTARPPLIELAYLNIKHWQSQSDQDNILHYARVPLLFTFTDDETFELKISSAKATRMPKDGKAEFVEHTGSSITAGRDSLKDLVEEMRMAGAKLLEKDRSANRTATQSEEDMNQELSPLARMAHQFQDALELLLSYVAKFSGVETAPSVEVRGNFEPDLPLEVVMPALQRLTELKALSRESLFSEMQRRNVISDEYEWKDELQRILDESVDVSEGETE